MEDHGRLKNKGKWNDAKALGEGISMIMKQVEGYRIKWNGDE